MIEHPLQRCCEYGGCIIGIIVSFLGASDSRQQKAMAAMVTTEV